MFLALPHGASGAIAAELDPETLVIDCGADHRLERPGDWAAFYGGDHHGAWSYGVPELPRLSGTQRDRLTGSRRIAAPGCNASTVALSLAPGIRAGVIEDRDLVSVLAVGPSGAGKSLKAHLLASEILGSANPYSVGGVHRHIPEITQALRWAGAAVPTISFTPVHRADVARHPRHLDGPHRARHGCRGRPRRLGGRLRGGAVRAGAARRPVPAHGRRRSGANTALMGLAVDEAAGRVVVVTAVDNLVKGTAGAAIQSANIALGLAESTGLPVNGVAP